MTPDLTVGVPASRAPNLAASIPADVETTAPTLRRASRIRRAFAAGLRRCARPLTLEVRPKPLLPRPRCRRLRELPPSDAVPASSAGPPPTIRIARGSPTRASSVLLPRVPTRTLRCARAASRLSGRARACVSSGRLPAMVREVASGPSACRLPRGSTSPRATMSLTTSRPDAEPLPPKPAPAVLPRRTGAPASRAGCPTADLRPRALGLPLTPTARSRGARTSRGRACARSAMTERTVPPPRSRAWREPRYLSGVAPFVDRARVASPLGRLHGFPREVALPPAVYPDARVPEGSEVGRRSARRRRAGLLRGRSTPGPPGPAFPSGEGRGRVAATGPGNPSGEASTPRQRLQPFDCCVSKDRPEMSTGLPPACADVDPAVLPWGFVALRRLRWRAATCAGIASPGYAASSGFFPLLTLPSARSCPALFRAGSILGLSLSEVFPPR